MATLYQQGLEDFIDGKIDLLNDTIKYALLGTGYTFSAAHEYWDDVSTNEVSSTNYTAGGQALGGKTVTLVSGAVEFDANDLVWGGVTFSARYGILYKDTGTASTSTLIAYYDFGSTLSLSSESVKIFFNNTNKVLKILSATVSS